MIYAMSDLHGCYDKYEKMLKDISFSDSDTLYVLGDVVDRGPDGIKLLFDMMERKNVIPIKGNHDYIAQRLLRLTMGNENICEDIMEAVKMWFLDGGIPTYTSFRSLKKDDKRKILSYLGTFYYFQDITVGNRRFLLSHTLPKKEVLLESENCPLMEYVIGEPEYDKVYFEDRFTVTGHTPTSLIDKNYDGMIYQENNHIAIDCGAVFGSPLGCICLDTLEGFYVD